MDPLSFVISNTEDMLSLRVINKGSRNISVNKKFSLGPSGDRGNIELAFTGNDGVKHGLAVKINYAKNTEADFVLLTPNTFIGKEISHADLIEFYDLKPGSYVVSGLYKNSFGSDKDAFVGKVGSRPTTVDIILRNP